MTAVTTGHDTGSRGQALWKPAVQHDAVTCKSDDLSKVRFVCIYIYIYIRVQIGCAFATNELLRSFQVKYH